MRMSSLVILLFSVAGCGSGEETRKAAQELHGESSAIIRAFHKALEPLQDHYLKYDWSEKVDVDAMSKDNVEFSSKTSGFLDQMKKIDVPDDPECKAYHTACVDLAADFAEYSKRYEKLIGYIKEHNPGSEADIEHARELWDEVTRPYVDLINGVGKAQEALVVKHGIKT